MTIYIWGTGRLAGKVIGRYIALEEIQGFIDNDISKKEYMGKKVIKPIELIEKQYDAIIVANLYAEDIRKQCLDIGLDVNKLIFLYNNCSLVDLNQDYDFVEKIVGESYANTVKKRYHVVRGVEAYGELCFDNSPYKEAGYLETDYVRTKSFELAVKELKKRNVAGAVAEVGVFRGEFAQYINYSFPDRKCYLFDTFEGFDANEALKEVKSGNCTDAFIKAYEQTNVKVVIDKMQYIDNIIIKQGFFPQSLDGLEEEFSFVSIDVDFEDSIYECLNYFYPRLNVGGYLFVHDYNSDLRGVEKAVDRYEKDNSVMLCKMPLPDNNGTLVITK